jgi:Protein of unknown function (DUF2946)
MAMATLRSQVPRPWALYLALLLAILGAVAPTVSHALAHQRGQVGIEICTTTGTKFVPADSSQEQESAAVLNHCPFCLLQTDRIAPPLHQQPYLFLVQGGTQAPAVLQAFLFVSNIFPAPPPRGPPALL